MTINFNAEPYYDDYSENNNFHRILFRPGYAVQARELTQLQTILQKQISRHGDAIFKEGSVVIPGEASIDRSIGYVKLQNTYNNTAVLSYIDQLVGEVVVGQTTGLRGLIQQVAATENSDPNTLFVKYLNTADDSTTKTFQANEILQPESITKQAYTVQVATTLPTGIGSVASIKRGVYYVLGNFVLVEDQTIVLNKYDNTPSYRIGLTIVEDLTSPEVDSTLLDNAQGSYNYAAPGAHRYKIDLILSKLAINSISDENFVQLMTVSAGQVLQKNDKTEYSELEKTLARRTYDESGDYVVRNFNLDVREHRNNDRGSWVTGKTYIINDIVLSGGKYYTAKTSGTSSNTAPTHTVGEATDGVGGVTWIYTRKPAFNRGVYKPEDGGIESKLALGLEPGKAYVRGYEIEKIATEFITVNKARDFEYALNQKITATVGNYVVVTKLNSVPDVNNLITIDLYDQVTSTKGVAAGTKIGTARARGLEWHSGTIGTDACQYKLFLFDIKMNTGKNFVSNVKQFFYNGGTAATSFSADINPIDIKLTGDATAATSTTVTGNGTLFGLELAVGDYIRIGSGSTSVIRRVTAINGSGTKPNTEITVDTAVTATGETIFKLVTSVLEPQNSSLVFPMPNFATKSVRDSIGLNQTSYTVAQKFLQAASSVSGGVCTLTIQTTGANDTFASLADSDNYLLVDNTTGIPVAPSAIAYVGGSANKQVIFTLPSAYASRQFNVIAGVNKSGNGTEKTKSLQSATPLVVSTAVTATQKVIKLAKADGYRLLAVEMDTGSFSSPTGTYGIDITDRYTFDDGQKDSYYDLCSISLNSGEAVPVAPIRIQYQYFNHTGPGDYFTVDSYASIAYDSIPMFNGMFLSDVIDFRPRIDDAGSTFSGSGSLTSLIPKRGIDVEADFSYYLARKDKLSLDINGKFFINSGVSSTNPGEPDDPAVGMLMYKITYIPYTHFAGSATVQVSPIDNKRYTMRDIGKLEKRIDNLEYYTSLSLLEQETKALTIIDSDTKLDRLKNGFIVDNFQGHGVGDSNSGEYRCSVDMEQGVLRPFFSMNNVNLIEVNANNVDRATNGYQITGDIVTLPYTNKEFISQPYASRVENINPFAIFTFLGQIDMNPSSDDWFETDRRPDIVTNVDGNFNTISTLAEKAGVLGTVWNAWQTQWTGTPVSNGIRNLNQSSTARDTLNSYGGNWSANGGWGLRYMTVETFATEIGQSRSGIKTSLVSKVDRTVTEDRVVSTAVIPYIRSRNVLVVARALKPKAKFNPFFDDVDISSYVTPATTLTFTPITGFSSSFDYTSNAGIDSQETARMNGTDVDTALSRGDVIFVKQRGVTTYSKTTSPATAVVALQQSINGTINAYIVNIKGSFQAGDVLEGSISGSRGTCTTAPTVKVKGDSLVATAMGDIVCIFNIPNTDSVRFRTGIREFKLTDATTANGDYTSRGRKQYRAEGVLQTRQASVTATRNAELVRETVSGTQTITQTSARVLSDTGWYDPLAQTFMVQQKGGAFLTKIDIFFATKDTSIPVQMEIREVVNGYPGKNVLPFSRIILTPEKVNISTDTVLVDGVSLAAPNVATSFVFPSPVYVQDATEYAIVLSSDSNNYKCWVSQLGEKNAGTDRFISEQPYAGVLFKSQNASTWTADQTQDLKFTIHRASFTTNSYAQVDFVNDYVPAATLDSNPIQTVAGTTKVRVYHMNHGLPNGSLVTISGVASAINGVPAAEINGSHTVSNVEYDSYVITVTTAATVSGFGGNSSVKATENYAFSTIQPIVQNQSFSDTSISFLAKTTSNQSVDGTEVPYIQEATFSPIIPNDNNEYGSARVVASAQNEAAHTLQKSLYLRALMQTTNEAVSPVIDTHRLSAILIRNKADTPDATNNVTELDVRTVISAANISVDGTLETFNTANSTTQTAFKTISIGKYITTTGFANAGNNGTFLVTSVASDGSYIGVSGDLTTEALGATAVVKCADKYVDEISPTSGTTYSKYLTKNVVLANASTFMKVRFAADVPPSASVDVYYKLSSVGSTNTLSETKYTLLQPDATISKNNDGLFYDVEYTLKNQIQFDAFVVKLVFRTTNEAEIARIKDLRIIACA